MQLCYYVRPFKWSNVTLPATWNVFFSQNLVRWSIQEDGPYPQAQFWMARRCNHSTALYLSVKPCDMCSKVWNLSEFRRKSQQLHLAHYPDLRFQAWRDISQFRKLALLFRPDSGAHGDVITPLLFTSLLKPVPLRIGTSCLQLICLVGDFLT